MAPIDAHTLELLEFSKVLPELEQHADSLWGRELARAVRPHPRLADAVRDQERTRAWAQLESADPAPPSLGVPEIRASLQTAAAGGALAASELLDVAVVAATSGRMRAVLKARGPELPVLAGDDDVLPSFTELERQIERSIDERGDVRDTASPELARLRRRLKVARSRLTGRLERIAATIGPSSVVTRRHDRLTVSVPTSQLGSVRGIVHDRSQSGATVFLEPLEIMDLQNELQGDERAEAAEVKRILRQLSTEVAAVAGALRAAAAKLAEFDLLRSRVRLWKAWRATLPELTAAGPIRLRAGRHPILERALAASSRKLVPLDLELGDPHRVIVVTGPNMGGKTVALKTLGLLSLLGMAGLPVPAAEGTRLGFFASIVADIGDEQSIEHDISTFASHLRQLRAAVERAGPDCLVLLDELGAGTDPAEGAALGQAVLEHLTARRAPTVATTHHGELKSLAVRHPAVVNASMGFDVDSHEPRYDLEIGVPGRSFALEVAERLGMQHDLLERAHQLVARDEARLQELIVDLDRQRQALLAERQALATERQALASARDRYRQRLERVRALRDRVDADARERARQLLNDAESALRDARRALRQAESSPAPGAGRAGAQELERVRQRLRELGERSAERPSAPPGRPGRPLDPREIAPGSRAWASALGEEVAILSIPNRAGRVRVQRGKFTLEVDCRQLSAIAAPATEPAPGTGSAGGGTEVPGPAYGVESSEPPSLELDLRGMTGDEAVEAVERYLDRAILHELRAVRIIHGVGTGVLRQRVQAFLREHPRVGAYRLGESGEGGAGVTVVQLRA